MLNLPRAAGRFRAISLAICLLCVSGTVWAGPPYFTDDPEPTDLGHWEDYLFLLGTHFGGDTTGQAGVELNYGAAKDLQLSLTLPFNYDDANNLQSARGNVLLGAKYRFVHQADGDWVPDMALYPQLTLPSASRVYGVQHPNLLLPLWMERDFGKWSTFGGFGYDINPGQGNRNYMLMGWAVAHDVSERLNLGAEIYHLTSAVVHGQASTNVALGFTYRITQHIALMASGGPGLENTRATGLYAFYASVQVLY
jgi:hypothetical protein